MTTCTCNPGYFLCPEAESLWARANDVYNTLGYQAFAEAKKDYERHIDTIASGALKVSHV